MAHVSRCVAVACGVLGILILLCGFPMIICGGVWMADFHDVRLSTAFDQFKHIKSAHGIWSGVLFIVGGGLGLILVKYPRRKLLIVFLVASSIVSIVGWVEVGLLNEIIRNRVGQAIDAACTIGFPRSCKFMATFRGIAAFAGIGALLAIGGIIAALVGIFSGQSSGFPGQQQPQQQVVVMQFGQGQPAPEQYPPGQYPTAQYPPGQYTVAQYPPGQYPAAQYPPRQYPAAAQYPPGQYPVAQYPLGQYSIVQYPSGQKVLAPPAYEQ